MESCTTLVILAPDTANENTFAINTIKFDKLGPRYILIEVNLLD